MAVWFSALSQQRTFHITQYRGTKHTFSCTSQDMVDAADDRRGGVGRKMFAFLLWIRTNRIWKNESPTHRFAQGLRTWSSSMSWLPGLYHGPRTWNQWSLPAKPMNSSGGEELNSSWRHNAHNALPVRKQQTHWTRWKEKVRNATMKCMRWSRRVAERWLVSLSDPRPDEWVIWVEPTWKAMQQTRRETSQVERLRWGANQSMTARVGVPLGFSWRLARLANF